MADVRAGKELRVQAKPNYTRKQAMKQPRVAEDLGELQIELPSPHKMSTGRFEKERQDYKDMVMRSVCNIHRMFTKKQMKHKPFFNCTIRAKLICHLCGHKGHTTGECVLMDSSMKAHAKKAPLGRMGDTMWLGKEGNYAKHYTFKKGVTIPRGSPRKVEAVKSKVPPRTKTQKAKVSAMPDYDAMTKNELMEILKNRGFTKSKREGQLLGPQAKRAWLIQTAKATHV